MKRAVGYIRRSHQDAGGHVSREEQGAALHELAERYGETLGEVFEDWGRLGGDSSDESDALAHRPGFRSLLRAMEAGEVSAVFAHRVDRLGRSSHALGRLWAASKKIGARVITTEGDFSDDDDPATYLMRHTFEGFAVYYLKEQTAKNRRAVAYMKKRGDELGAAPFGYERHTPKRNGTDRVQKVKKDPDAIDAVLAAYRDAGRNYRQAALILNEAGDPKPARADKWYATSVAAVVQRHAPEEAKKAASYRERKTTPRLFRRLLKCHCGATMTPTQSGRSWGYLCPQGHHDARHPRPVVVSERKLRPWIEAEAARLRTPEKVIVPGDDFDDRSDRAALETLRGKVSDAVIDAGLADLDAKRDEHGERQELVRTIPPSIDWAAWTTEAINTALRALWDHVELGPDLLPVEAVWTVPQWRS